MSFTDKRAIFSRLRDAGRKVSVAIVASTMIMASATPIGAALASDVDEAAPIEQTESVEQPAVDPEPVAEAAPEPEPEPAPPSADPEPEPDVTPEPGPEPDVVPEPEPDEAPDTGVGDAADDGATDGDEAEGDGGGDIGDAGGGDAPSGDAPGIDGDNVGADPGTADGVEPSTPAAKPPAGQSSPVAPAAPSTANAGTAPSDAPVRRLNVSARSTAVSLMGRQRVDLTTEKFVATIGETMRVKCADADLYASVAIAQAILESGSGSSTLSQAPNNNLFGIKGAYVDEGGEARSVLMDTKEDAGDGTLYGIRSAFRAYPTTAESIDDYVALLTDEEDGMGAYYKGATKSEAESYEEAAGFLQGRYATDTSYAEKLCSLIETYGLDRFDSPFTLDTVDEETGLTEEGEEPREYAIAGQVEMTEEEREADALLPEEERVDPDGDGCRDLTMEDYAALQTVATSFLGTDYLWGGETPETGFDCSGLVQWAYKQALGIDTTRTTYTQQHQGVEVELDEESLRMGDLLFFERGGDVHHVAMYLGDGCYIHAPKPGDVVKVTTLEEYAPSFARRLVDFEPVVEEEPVEEGSQA